MIDKIHNINFSHSVYISFAFGVIKKIEHNYNIMRCSACLWSLFHGDFHDNSSCILNVYYQNFPYERKPINSWRVHKINNIEALPWYSSCILSARFLWSRCLIASTKSGTQHSLLSSQYLNMSEKYWLTFRCSILRLSMKSERMFSASANCCHWAVQQPRIRKRSRTVYTRSGGEGMKIVFNYWALTSH